MFDQTIERETIKRDGQTFLIEVIADDLSTPPWEWEDGHGEVSDWTTAPKRPGELVLCEDRGSFRYYDAQATMKKAKREGWDAAPFGQGTKGQRAARAVRQDFNRLRGWCAGEWCWACVVVTSRCACCGEFTSVQQALAGLRAMRPSI
jgi:hypothetical protein